MAGALVRQLRAASSHGRRRRPFSSSFFFSTSAAAAAPDRSGSSAAMAAGPELLLPGPMPSFHHSPAPYTGPSSLDILDKRRRFMNPSIVLYYKKHVSSIFLRSYR
jgi:hypothetical protein